MLDTVFLVAAIVGGTIMVCQFLLMFLGMGDDGSGDLAADGDFSADADFATDVSTDADLSPDSLEADHHTSWSQVADADVGHPDSARIFEVLSFRSVVAALAFFGFAGKASLASQLSETQSLLIGLVAGGCAMYGMYWIMAQIYKLRAAGNENIRNALGKPASVYVAIPGHGKGMGKVHLLLQNRTVEYQAITEQDSPLSSGDQVVVVDILGPDKVLVESADTVAAEA